MTALIDTLFQLEKQLGIELDTLLPFAEADDLGGYHPDEHQRKWGSGAVWEVEGKTLYALVMALSPKNIVEIGSGTGCSTNHMAAALLKLQTIYGVAGHITTIDRANTPYVAHDLRGFIDVRNDDAINYLALQPDNSIDFLLEDADHSIQLCQAIGELAKTKLKPGGVLIAHDAAHPGVGADVKRGYDLAGLDFRVYLTDPSDCGWAVWKRPNDTVAAIRNVYGQLKEQAQTIGLGAISEEYEIKQPDDSPLTAIDFAVLQAQEEPNAQVAEAINILTDALHDDEPSEEKVVKLLHSAPPAEKTVKRTRKKAAK